jgi:hypothetical protein
LVSCDEWIAKLEAGENPVLNLNIIGIGLQKTAALFASERYRRYE